MWNYRLVKIEDDGENFLEIREVFYDSEGIPFGHSTATVYGETVIEIESTLNYMIKALDKPTLYSDSFKGDPYKEGETNDE